MSQDKINLQETRRRLLALIEQQALSIYEDAMKKPPPALQPRQFRERHEWER